MSVFRVEKSKNYTVMSNHHLRNKELSLKSKGLLSLMLSLPDEWDYTLKGLSMICKEGIDAIRVSTEATFDAYLWQTIENKQKFISQIMTSKSPVRSCDDIDETALSYAEIKALCAGDERIKEKMDLDIDVAKLRLMKANHKSQQYRLEDNLMKHFPEQIEQNKGYIDGFKQDMKMLAEHPHPKDEFAGMTVRNDYLTDKENAGAALVDAFKEVKGLDPVQIGNYRGFNMYLTLEDFGKEYILTLKGKMTHRVTLGKDPRGNLEKNSSARSVAQSRKTLFLGFGKLPPQQAK